MRLSWMVICVWLLAATPLQAWNEKGHWIVAKLAWVKLDPGTRKQVTEILKAHPHYAEYLSADCPDQIPLDEWAFLRAAYWPDWVRGNHSEEYNRPTWHYVTVAYVPPYSKMQASKLEHRFPTS